MSPRPVAIVGSAQLPFRSRYPEQTYPELVYSAASAALKDARATRADIDAVVIPVAPDALLGVVHAERWAADAAGALGKPLLRVHTGGSTGLSAVQVGYDLVASGEADVVLVAGADRVGESGDAQSILNRIWDPIYERALPLNTITMLAMQAVRFMRKYGATEEDMARVSVKDHRAGLRNPNAHIRQEVTVAEVLTSRMIAWPIKLLDSCPTSSGGAALVLCAGDRADRHAERPAWIRGLGHCTETYWMGDRMGPFAEADHADSPALSAAVRAAYHMAGIGPDDLQVAELYAPFSNIELHAIQDADLCAPGEVMRELAAGAFDHDGRVAVNPSGGVLCANAISVTALVRVIEAALQVRGLAGAHQVAGARHALATGIGGDHQYFGAMVVSADMR